MLNSNVLLLHQQTSGEKKMSETRFKASRVDLAIVQSHLSIFDEDRSRCLKALGAMRVAEEMYEMLNFLVNNDSINDVSIDREVVTLLAKARGGK